MQARIPVDEAGRLDALRKYQILDTPPEAEWDDLTFLAAHICDTPMAAAVLIDKERQWFKSVYGFEGVETPREVAFCAHTILEDDLVLVHDTLTDKRFADHPRVVEQAGIRFYAGIPLVTPSGYKIGSLCVVDRVPRQLTEDQQEALRRLHRQAISLLETRLSATQDRKALEESERRFRFLNDLNEATTAIACPRKIMATVARILGQHLNASRCAYAEVQDDGEQFSILDDYTDGCESTVGQYHLSLFGSRALREMRSGGTLVIRNVDEELEPQDGADMFNAIGIKAIVCCPLIKQGTLRAMMAVHQTTPRVWTGLEVALIEEVVERSWAIIERARAEMVLRESEEHLRFVIDATNDGIWEWDIVNNEVYWSERVFEMLGLSPETFHPTFERILELIHPDDLDKIDHAIAEHCATGKPYHLRRRYRHSNGSYVPILTQGRMQYDAAGKPLRMVGSYSDLTNMVQAEAEREARQREIVTIWESMTDAFYTLDHDWRFTHVNSQAAQLLERESEDLIGKIIWEEFPEALGTAFEQEYFRAVREQAKVDFEEFYAPLNRWYEMHAYPSSVGLSVYFRNISERKQNETEKAELLQREQLARKDAENTNRIKDEFLATVSHELRTPLTAILGWSSMLREGDLDPEIVTRAIETIERNARAQVQLVDDLLDVSRIITGKLSFEVRPVQLAEVIQAAVDAVRPAVEAKGLHLQVMLDPKVGSVSGDADRLQQVVWNMLSNAVKFTPRDGQVQVRLEQADSHVEIIVSDTGRGLDEAFLPHIFDRFRQADQTSTRAYGGLGLGLSIVQQIVQMHGGTVQVESAGVGQGATFVVRLPRRATHSGLPPTERRHPTANDTLSDVASEFDCPSFLAGLRVLVVDDEADTRQMLRAVLEHCGCEIAIAESAAQALKVFQQSPPEIVVSDIGMPEEDGYSLIRKVREWESRHNKPRVPAIALTAYARMEDRVRALRAGFQVHTPKPIQPIELIAVVASLVDHNKN